MDISAILLRNYPESKWTLNGNSYDGLEWISEDSKPSLDQLETEWPEVEYQIAHEAVDQARRIAYRNESDPIFFEYQRGDKTEQEWIDAVQAIKDAHPYPDAP